MQDEIEKMIQKESDESKRAFLIVLHKMCQMLDNVQYKMKDYDRHIDSCDERNKVIDKAWSFAQGAWWVVAILLICVQGTMGWVGKEMYETLISLNNVDHNTSIRVERLETFHKSEHGK